MLKVTRLHCFIPIISIGLMLFAIPSPGFQADAGPHPSMQFVFTSKITPESTVVSGKLMECQDNACVQSGVLPELGPQRFECQNNTCQASGYSFSPYHRLMITFSDGVTRQSNIFTKTAFAADYLVAIHEDSLLVEEKPVGPYIPIFKAGSPTILDFLATLAFPLFEIILPIILLGFVYRTGRADAVPATYKNWLEAAWLLGIPAVFVGVSWTQGLLITLVVELLLGLGYALWKKRSIKINLTVIFLLNLITQPVLWISLSGFSGLYSIGKLLFAEVIVLFVEAGGLYLSQRNSMKFREALLVGFVLNAASFLVGLFIPL